MTLSAAMLRLAVLVAGSTLLATAGRAADTPILAFGDSITEGYGDDPSNPNPGYPPRLEGLLDGAGYPVRIRNHGSGGETTAEGLSRIDSVLDEGGEVLLLMEGTNDINRQISGETIRYNLNAIASKAEARGLRVVHATVIPHRPDGDSGDVQNFATRDVRDDILGLAASQRRAVVDAFSLFWREPDYASRFYVDLPPEIDPVGHPNADGYELLAEEFFPVVRDLLASGTGSGRDRRAHPADRRRPVGLLRRRPARRLPIGDLALRHRRLGERPTRGRLGRRLRLRPTGQLRGRASARWTRPVAWSPIRSW